VVENKLRADPRVKSSPGSLLDFLRMVEIRPSCPNPGLCGPARHDGPAQYETARLLYDQKIHDPDAKA